MIEGLKNKEGVFKVRFFRNLSQAKKFLEEDKVTTAAGSYGAINIYVDDEDVFRGYRYFMFGERSRIISLRKKELFDWLKIELPKIFGEPK